MVCGKGEIALDQIKKGQTFILKAFGDNNKIWLK